MFDRIAEGVFDGPIMPEMLDRFLGCDLHHMALAREGDLVVGMASSNIYLHPDKPVQAWINEVGVAPSHRCRGIGRSLVTAMADHLRSLGITSAWAATEHDNAASRAMFRAAGWRATEGIVMLELDPPCADA